MRLGMRLGKLQSKIGAVSILKDFKFTLADALNGKKIRFASAGLIIAPVGGINLKVEKR